MTFSELIAAYGDDKVEAQYLDQCVRTMNYDQKRGTTITFGTTMNIYADEGTEKLGIVFWLDRDRVAEIIKQSKAEPRP